MLAVELGSMGNRRFFIAFSIVLAVIVAQACSDSGSSPSVGSLGKATDATASADTPAASDLQSNADTGTPPVATCAGSALNDGFKALDKDCDFLNKCPSLGKCYCGDKCPATKAPKCDASLCPNKEPKCYCGEGCAAAKKKCPQLICDPLDVKDCKELDDCTYVNTAPPSWCGCQKMPSHAPDCWCNANLCSEPRPQCAASKCSGKATDKCLYVKGEDHTSCWCDACGLFGETARCFFVLCPNG